MRISTKGRYALRLMIDLALNDSGEYITLKSISKRQNISVKYLEQIILLLVRFGYVKGLRGAKGGYKLSKLPSEYTVGMILRVTEGSLSPVACIDEEPNKCERSGQCITLNFWKRLNGAINDIIDNITLSDLINDYKNNTGNDYSI